MTTPSSMQRLNTRNTSPPKKYSERLARKVVAVTITVRDKVAFRAPSSNSSMGILL